MKLVFKLILATLFTSNNLLANDLIQKMQAVFNNGRVICYNSQTKLTLSFPQIMNNKSNYQVKLNGALFSDSNHTYDYHLVESLHPYDCKAVLIEKNRNKSFLECKKTTNNTIRFKLYINSQKELSDHLLKSNFEYLSHFPKINDLKIKNIKFNQNFTSSLKGSYQDLHGRNKAMTCLTLKFSQS